jgi:hypothetical protein
VSGGFFDARGIKIPAAVTAFPDEVYTASKSWAGKAEFFAADMRAAFTTLRS